MNIENIEFVSETGLLDVAGSSLEYRLLGPPPETAPTIVMLHEGLGSVSMWRDFPERLLQATGLGVFAYSRKGYGRSSACQLPRPLSYMHDEALDVLPGVLESIGFRRGILLGHSDGASIAAIYAGGRDDPRVRGLILMAPHFFTEDEGIESIARIKADFHTTDLRRRLYKYHGDNVDGAFRGWNDAWLDPEFRRWDIREFLKNICVPVLILQGEEDEYGSEKQIDAARVRCGASVETVLLPRCAHAPHKDQPQRTLDEILSFVIRISDSCASSSSEDNESERNEAAPRRVSKQETY
ncbi:MAG: alpha/beta hydrolase [Gammaproteobacteria bacterium]|nr:alpha/beta hydrolase [Gammaproteobacteria bacterium]